MIQYVASISPYLSASGGVQKYFPATGAHAGKLHHCWSVGGVSSVVAGVWGSLGVSEEEWGGQGDGSPCEVEGTGV